MSTRITTQPLPLAYDEEHLTEALTRIAGTYGVTLTVVEEERDPSGWPSVTLTGPVANVVDALLELWSSGEPEDDRAMVVAALTELDDADYPERSAR